MKGIIFILYETYVSETYGKEALEKTRTRSKVPSRLIATDNYPDEYLGRLLTATASTVGKTPDEIEFEFGKKIIPRLNKVYPIFFKPGYKAKDFLSNMDYVHGEATRILGSSPPQFEYHDPSPKEFIMYYSSKKRLCTFMKGLIHGVLDFYNEKGSVQESSCMKRGATRCEVKITFEK